MVLPLAFANILKFLVHSMLSIFGSHSLMLLISFADVIRTPIVEKIEARVTEAR